MGVRLLRTAPTLGPAPDRADVMSLSILHDLAPLVNFIPGKKRFFDRIGLPADNEGGGFCPSARDCRKSSFCFDNGKEDRVKETQEVCLSRSINDFFERSLFKKVALSGAKRLFRHAEAEGSTPPPPLSPPASGREGRPARRTGRPGGRSAPSAPPPRRRSRCPRPPPSPRCSASGARIPPG